MSIDRKAVLEELIGTYGEQAAKDAMQNPEFIKLLQQGNMTNMPVERLIEQWGIRNELTPLSEQNLNDPQVLQSKINAGSEAAIAYETKVIDKPDEIKNLSNKEKEKFEKAREDAEDITVPRQQAQESGNDNDKPQSPSPFSMKPTPYKK